jgi:hypothetical protein
VSPSFQCFAPNRARHAPEQLALLFARGPKPVIVNPSRFLRHPLPRIMVQQGGADPARSTRARRRHRTAAGARRCPGRRAACRLVRDAAVLAKPFTLETAVLPRARVRPGVATCTLVTSKRDGIRQILLARGVRWRSSHVRTADATALKALPVCFLQRDRDTLRSDQPVDRRRSGRKARRRRYRRAAASGGAGAGKQRLAVHAVRNDFNLPLSAFGVCGHHAPSWRVCAHFR